MDARFGVLLRQVKFSDTTDGTTLFSDDFSGDNLTYIPPRCGQGTTSVPGYGFYIGTDCAYLNTCLNAPVPVQLSDPSPLPDIEAGESSGTPGQKSATQTVCIFCLTGFNNVASSPLTPSSQSDTGTNNIATLLDGKLWLMPVPGAGLTGPRVNDPPDIVQTITGTAGEYWLASLRIRGVIEVKNYEGSLRTIPIGKTGTPPVAAFAVYKFSSLPSTCLACYDTYNEYLLIISDPPQIILLNNSAWEGDAVFPVDYTINVPIAVGATVTLRARSVEGSAVPNVAAISVPDDISSPILVQQPYPGQFLQMDVVAVVPTCPPPSACTSLPCTGYAYWAYSSGVTLSKVLALAISSATANNSVEWNLKGSNDGSAWTQIAAYAGVPDPGHWTNTGQGTMPGPFKYYRMDLIHTVNGQIPTDYYLQLVAAPDSYYCITPPTITPSTTLPFTRQWNFSAAQTVDNYTLAVPSSASNWPTVWTFSGSNDGETWTTLDTRDIPAYAPRPGGTVYRYAIPSPAAYLHSRC